MIELPPDFIHEAPAGFRYRTAKHSAVVVSIWCDHLNSYCFNNGDQVSTIWGFTTQKNENTMHQSMPRKSVQLLTSTLHAR